MRTVRKPYQMYVLNLDALRIFWITIILFLLLFLTFFVGYFIGKERAKSEIEKLAKKNEKIMEDVLKNINQNKTDDDDSEFYELMNTGNVPEKRNIENSDDIEASIEKEKKIEEKIPEPEPVPAQNKRYIPAKKRIIKRKISSAKSPSFVIEYGDKRLSKKRPYTIQVASYRNYKNALLLYRQLKNQQFPAYIIKSKVNHIMYYRIRVGTFPSKTLSLKVLSMVKRLKGCEDSFLTTK